MKKKVNGKVIDIKNIELFEKAAEGAALERLAASLISDKLTVEASIINDCIERYEAFYRALPFPLYAIETNCKYAAMGTFIRSTLEDELPMWVNEALYIGLNLDDSTKSRLALKIISNTWGVVSVPDYEPDNVDIDRFKYEIGYKEYKWVIDKVLNREPASDFYKEFMPEFLEACGDSSMVLRWELSNILNFGAVPENRLQLKENKVIDIETLSEFSMDIYLAGTRKLPEQEYVFVMGKSDISLRQKTVKVYNYDVYEKPGERSIALEQSDNNRIQKNSLPGFLNLFKIISGLKINAESQDTDYKSASSLEMPSFTGIIADRNLIYQVDNRIFICKAYRMDEMKEIARGAEIYGYDRGRLYLVKSSNIGRGIKKEVIYSYSVKDAKVRMCRIQFIV